MIENSVRSMFKARFAEVLLLASVPIYIGSVGLYGTKMLLILVLSICAGLLVDQIMKKFNRESYTSSTWLIWIVFPLAFPPGSPIWLVPIAVAFALIFGCYLFGGYGRSLFPVACMAVVFLSLSYPAQVNTLTKPFSHPLLGFSQFASQVPVSGTVFSDLKRFADIPLTSFLKGHLPGNPGDSYGGLLLGFGLLFLFLGILDTRFAFSAVSTTIILAYYGHLYFPQQVLEPAYQILAGSFLLYLVFFVPSDPFSLPRTPEGRWAGGFLFGLFTVLIRSFSGFSEGVFFAGLLVSLFSPLFDQLVAGYRYSRVKPRL